jgi:hypothetical protein
MSTMSRLALAFACLLLGPAAVSLAQCPQDRYFVLVFGSQPTLKCPRRCHTWATIVKTSPDKSGVIQVEAHTISWMPADQRVKLLTFRSKPGMNLDLMSTIARYQDMNGHVAVWGPYEIQDGSGSDIYARTLQQIARLESGEVQYKAIDPDFGPRVHYISDCIHAITDIDQQQARSFYSEFIRFGESASRFIVNVLAERGRINPAIRHDWVLDSLGLSQMGLVRR